MGDGDVRWYEINMASAGLLSVNAKSDHSNIISILIYDPSGNFLGSQSCTYSGQVSLDKALTVPGIYKIQVIMGGIPIGYTTSKVRVSSNLEMTMLPAYENPCVSMEAGDAGWYDIVVSEASIVCMNAVSDHSNIIQINLYDPSGTAIGEEKSSYSGNYSMVKTLASPGNYKYKVTLGDIPYGTTVSNVSIYHFVMPLAGGSPAVMPLATPKGSPTASPAAGPTLPDTPGVSPGPTMGDNGIPLMFWLLPLFLAVVVLSSAGYVVMKRSKKPGTVPAGHDSATPVSQMPAESNSADLKEIDVFISYSSKDKNVADAVCHGLENQKIRCWIAPRDVIVGKSFEESIIGAINRSRILVLIFSANANLSQHIENEVRSSWKRGIPIIPFRLEDIPFNSVMDYYIGSRHWLDGMTPPLEKHIDELAVKVQGLLKEGGKK